MINCSTRHIDVASILVTRSLFSSLDYDNVDNDNDDNHYNDSITQ